MIKWCLEVEELDDEENAVVIEGEDPVFDARLVLEVNDKQRVKKGTYKESRRKPKSEIYKIFNKLETKVQNQIIQQKFQTNF